MSPSFFLERELGEGEEHSAQLVGDNYTVAANIVERQ
jgi:hypothetical protein